MSKDPVINNLKVPYKKWSSSSSSMRGPQFRYARERKRQEQSVIRRIDVCTITLGPGVIGYKGTVLETGSIFKWPPPAPKVLEDWSGLYVGSRDQAEGNLSPDSGNGDGYLLEIWLNRSFPAYEVTSDFIADHHVTGPDKASFLKKKLMLPAECLLMPALGGKSFLYKGPLSLEDKEIIIPTNLIRHTGFRIVEKYRISNFVSKKVSP